MATDRELAAQAEAHLRRTTVSYPEFVKRVAAGRYTPKDGSGTEWGKAFAALEQVGGVVPPPPPPPPTGNRYTPPVLSDRLELTVPATGPLPQLDPARDYVLKLGDRQQSLVIDGRGSGRNIIVTDGRIRAQGTNAQSVRAFVPVNFKGQLHFENVRITDAGVGFFLDYLLGATVTLQTVRCDRIDSPWNVHHPDVIQSVRGPHTLRIDKLTAYTGESAKGVFSMADGDLGPYPVSQTVRNNFIQVLEAHRVNIVGCHWPLQVIGAMTKVTLSDFWAVQSKWQGTVQRRLQDGVNGPHVDVNGNAVAFHEPGPYRVLGVNGEVLTVTTQAAHSADASNPVGGRQGDRIEKLSYPNGWAGFVTFGVPPGGDFVV